MATLTKAVQTASLVDENVYATVGTYSETLNIANGVSVYGGYDTSWEPSPTGVSTITGGTDQFSNTEAAVATAITSRTTLEDVTLAPAVPDTSGASPYGLRGDEAGGLQLVDVTINAVAGAPGAAGPNGAAGQNGSGGTDGARGCDCGTGDYIAGGTGSAGAGGHDGGDGGNGYTGTAIGSFGAGDDGAPGQSVIPDACGLQGGAGGLGGSSQPTAGNNGRPGEPGCIGAGAGGPSIAIAGLTAADAPDTEVTVGNGGNGGAGGRAGGGGGEGTAGTNGVAEDFLPPPV